MSTHSICSHDYYWIEKSILSRAMWICRLNSGPDEPEYAMSLLNFHIKPHNKNNFTCRDGIYIYIVTLNRLNRLLLNGLASYWWR